MAEETLIETEENEEVVETIDPPVIDSKYRMIITWAATKQQATPAWS